MRASLLGTNRILRVSAGGRAGAGRARGGAPRVQAPRETRPGAAWAAGSPAPHAPAPPPLAAPQKLDWFIMGVLQVGGDVLGERCSARAESARALAGNAARPARAARRLPRRSNALLHTCTCAPSPRRRRRAVQPCWWSSACWSWRGAARPQPPPPAALWPQVVFVLFYLLVWGVPFNESFYTAFSAREPSVCLPPALCCGHRAAAPAAPAGRCGNTGRCADAPLANAPTHPPPHLPIPHPRSAAGLLPHLALLRFHPPEAHPAHPSLPTPQCCWPPPSPSESPFPLKRSALLTPAHPAVLLAFSFIFQSTISNI